MNNFNFKNTINGNIVLLILDLLILFMYIMEIYLHRKYPCIKDCPDTVSTKIKRFTRLLNRYYRNGLLIVDIFFLILMILGSTLTNDAFSLRFIVSLLAVMIIFVIMYFSKQVLFNAKGFESNAVNHEIDTVYHLIAAQVFVLAVPAISLPSLYMMLTGLTFALILCFIIIIRTIIDPTVLIHRSKSNKASDALQLIKGMLVILLCIWIILYLMVYACWRVNPDFYIATTGSIEPLDLLYYMFVAFSTIGFGDIVAVKVDGMFFSRAVAIIIAISGFFTTSCLIGAVVSGASGLNSNTNSDQDEKKEISK